MTHHHHHDNHHHYHRHSKQRRHRGCLHLTDHPHQTECHPLTGILHLEITLRPILLETVLHLTTASLHLPPGITSIIVVTFLPGMGPAEWTMQCTQLGTSRTGTMGGPQALPIVALPIMVCHHLLLGGPHHRHSTTGRIRIQGVRVAPTCLGPPHLSDQGSCKCLAMSVFLLKLQSGCFAIIIYIFPLVNLYHRFTCTLSKQLFWELEAVLVVFLIFCF